MLTKISIKRPVTVCMIIIMIFMGGFISYKNLELAYMPSTDSPMVMISAQYSGAGPEEVCELVTKPIEQSLSTITGVDTISSTSSTGSARIMLEFTDSTDLTEAVQDIRDKMEQITRQLPDDVDTPSIMKMDMNADSINVGITSNTYDVSTLYKYVDENIESEFEKIEGVASVSLMGGIDTEIQVIFNEQVLESYGLSLSGISSTLSKENQDSSAGTLNQGSSELTIRVTGAYDSIEDIKNTYITTSGGTPILLKDIADSIEEVELEQERISLINGKEGVSVELTQESDANVVTVSKNINAAIEELSAKYPDLNFTVLTTTADYIETSVNNVVSTAFQSAAIAIIVLLFFLRDPKTAFIIGVSIPASIFATFILMYLKGMTMNTISMGGIVIGIGMLVDNSVVVLENVFTHWKSGKSAKAAATDGTLEVAMAVTASTLTTIAVFGPLIFVSGTVGQLLQDLAYTICFALIASLVVSITFVPMACALLMSSHNKVRKRPQRNTVFTKLGSGIGKALENLEKGYRRLLAVALKHRLITVLIAVICFVGSLSVSGNIGKDLMGRSDEGSFSISVNVPDGYNFEYTNDIINEVIEKMGDIPEKTGEYTNISSSNARIMINLVDSDQRSRSTDEIVADVKNKLSDIAGAEINVSASAMAMGSMGGSSFTIKLIGDDTDTLREIVNDLSDLIGEIDGVSNIESSLDSNNVEINLVVDRAKAASYGLSGSDIASAIRMASEGVDSTTLKVDGTETSVTVMYPEDNATYVKDLNSMTITANSGAKIPLTEIASMEMGTAAQSINRENMTRYINLTGEVTGYDTSTIQTLLKEKLDTYIFPENYSYEFGGSMRTMENAFSSLYTVIVVAILLVFMIMASQFESLIHPIIVMFSMPLAITGGLFGLFITGVSLTVYGYMGFIMLVGMVVNNAIVLVDYANQLRRDHGMGCTRALLNAGQSRLRPILMTTMTTILGLMPMALSLSTGMETQQSLGIAVIFGLTISTIVTLVLIPVLYSITNGIVKRLRKLWAKLSPYEEIVPEEEVYSE